MPKLPPASYASVATQEVWVTMDDGVRLAGMLYMPSGDGRHPAAGRFPVVLSMTPYGHNLPAVSSSALAAIFAERGIAYAEFDIRGAGGSGGTLAANYFSPREARDSAAVIQWLGRRPWSTGRVGMAGGSYLGITQYLAAEQQPSHLRAIVPEVALADLYRDAYTHGGVPNLFFDAQYIAVQGLPGLFGASNSAAHLGETIKAKLGQQPPGFIAFDYLARPDDDPFYAARSPITLVRRIKVPVLILDGWRDGFVRGAIEMYKALARRRGVVTRLQIGPCTHKGCGGAFAPFDNPPGVDSDSTATFLFLSHFLRGTPLPPAAPVRLYVQGTGRYVASRSWPPRGSAVQRLYLAPGGGLGRARPAAGVASYPTDPAAGFSMSFDEYGTIAITPYLPLDQRLEELSGATWRTARLARPLTLAGPLALHLVAASSATDTDWYAKLSDVAPDGSETIVTEGALRASHRALDRRRSTPIRPYQTHVGPQPLTPGRRYDFDIEIWPTAYRLAAGHRLQLRLTSSDLPTHLPGSIRFDRADLAATYFAPLPSAINTVALGGGDPSALLVTVAGR